MEEEVEVEVSARHSLRRQQSKNLRIFCTLPEPPSRVYAIGRNESAEIWWTKDYGEITSIHDIQEWEITRYRKDKKEGKTIWNNKGSMKLLQMGNIHQCKFIGLRNHSEYRFTVSIKTEEGYSMESSPSNIVYVDAPPPVGWKLLYEQSSKQYYYFNLFFRTSQLSRPEKDPFFIEDHVAKKFSRRELQKFKDIWTEELMHHDTMTIIRLKVILLELGENIDPLIIRDHMKAYVRSETDVRTFKGFMDILFHIKLQITNPSKKKQKTVNKTPKSYAIGDWSAEFHAHANKWHYRNLNGLFNITDTWDMTWEVRFFLSDEDYFDIHNHFDFGMVERIRAQFDDINSSHSGSISPEEFDMFLVAMHAVGYTDDKKKGLLISELERPFVNSLFRKIDINSNGKIEFNEFCLMMCFLVKKKTYRGLLGKIQEFDLIRKLAESGPIKIPLSPTLFLDRVAKRIEKEKLLKRIANAKKAKSSLFRISTEISVGGVSWNSSTKSRKIHYEITEEEAKGSDVSAVTDNSINYDDEELDELRALAPPATPRCFSLMKHFQDQLPFVQDILMSMNLVPRPAGPHGRFCLCGCREIVI